VKEQGQADQQQNADGHADAAIAQSRRKETQPDGVISCREGNSYEIAAHGFSDLPFISVHPQGPSLFAEHGCR
jgi:hypothetical protein